MAAERWASRADRDEAIRLVESAWADGQIVEADRDRRVDELGRAETQQDVELLVLGLRAPSYAPVPVDPVAIDPVLPPGQRTQRPGGGLGTVAALSVSVLLVAGVLIVGSRTDGDDVEPESSGPLAVLTEEGYDDLVAAVRHETGSTEAFGAVLYPEYASLDLPVDATSQRERSWFWDGDLSTTSAGTATEERFDLAEVDLALVLRLLTRVQDVVDQETSWYAIVHAPAEHDGSVYQVYASNDFHELAYVTATADGTVTYESTPSP